MWRVRFAAVPAVAVATAALVAACGGGSATSSPSSASRPLTLGQEFPAIKKAVRAATSVQVSGTVLASGQRESVDLTVTTSGAATGWVTENGAKVTILVTHGKSYVLVNAAFLKLANVSTAICSTVCGKYLLTSGSSASSISSGLSMKSMVDQGFTAPTKSQAKAQLTPTVYQGQPAWFVRWSSYTAYIARQGAPYVLLITDKNGQVLHFSGWDTASVPGPPSASDIVTQSDF